MNDKPNRAQPRGDDVAQTHTKMLRALQSKTLGKHEIAERMTTTIETDDRTHSFETSRDENGVISTNIRTVPGKTAHEAFPGEQKNRVTT